MKRKKRTQRLLAMLLILMLCMGEFASTGFSVLAADDEIADTVSDEEIVSDSDNVVPDKDKSGREASGNETTEPEEEMSEEKKNLVNILIDKAVMVSGLGV